MREPGFYWVKQYDKWIIAEYDKDRYENNYFWTTMYSDDYCFDDAEFQEIDERRIIREEHNNWIKIEEFDYEKILSEITEAVSDEDDFINKLSNDNYLRDLISKALMIKAVQIAINGH